MTKNLLVSMLAVALAACSVSEAKELTVRPVVAIGVLSLPNGTSVTATLRDSITSRVNKAGDGRRAIVAENVLDDAGNVLIPVGATVMLSIAELEPGIRNSTAQGTLRLEVTALSIKDRTYPITAELETVPHYMQPRNATGVVVLRVSAGSAAGTFDAVSDVVVPRGTPIVFTLTQVLKIRPR